MLRILAPALVFQLHSPWLSAAREETEQQLTEVETVSMIYVLLFAILFIGMIVGFLVRVFMNDKNAESEKS